VIQNTATRKPGFAAVHWRGKRADNYQVRNGRYYLRVYDPDKGKTIRIPQPEITTDEECYQASVAFQGLASEDRPKGSVPTLNAFWAEYEAEAMLRLRPATLNSYRINWEKHIQPVLGTKKLDKITKAHVHGVLTNMRTGVYLKGLHQQRKTSYSAQTVYNVQTVMSAIFTAAVDAGYRSDNPVSKLSKRQRAHQPDPVEVGDEKVFTPEEIVALVTAAEEEKDWRMAAAMRLAADSGFRISELAGLKIECVNFLRGSVKVSWQLEKDSVSEVGPLKWRQAIGVGARTVYPRPETMAALQRYVDQLSRDALWIGPKGWLFPTRNGTATLPAHFGKRLTELMEKVGIDRPMSFHCFRHTFVSYLAYQGFSAGHIGRLIGDAPDVVQKVYSHWINEDEFAAKVQDALQAAHG
jgi:integrase